MKSLFLTVYMYTPHLETEMELMSQFMAAGKDVYVVGCRGQLPTCQLNPEHLKHVCVFCRSKFENGLARIGIPKDHILDFPEPKPDYSRLPKEFATAEELLAFEIDGMNIGRGAASSLISRINKDPHFDTRKHSGEVRRELEASYFIHRNLRLLLDKVRPDEVYLFNGRFSTYYPLVALCRSLGIPFYTHERAGMPGKFLIRKNCLPHDLAWAAQEIDELWQQKTTDNREAIGAEWFEGRRNGVETAWLCYTTDQSVGKLPDSFNSARRNVAIFSSTLEEFATIPGYENPLFKDEVEAVRHVLTCFQNDPNIRFYLRMHPNMRGIPVQDTYQLREVAAMQASFSNLEVIWPASSIHTYALMDACNSVLTFGSTMGIEANYWGKPSILVGRAFYEQMGACYRPKDREELISFIKADLKPMDKQIAIRYGYWEINRGIPFQRFQQEGIFGGRFDGRPLGASRVARLRMLFIQFLAIRSPKDLVAFVQEKGSKLRVSLQGGK